MNQDVFKRRHVAILFLLMHSPMAFSDTICPSPDPVVANPPPLLSNPSPTGETPASLACIYGLTPNVPGCPISGTSATPGGGWGAIAVVEGGHDPNAYAELTAFSQQFGLRVLPLCPANPTINDVPCFGTFTVGSTAPAPAADVGEHVIDIEWAHAMAPNASIYMVEGDSLCVPSVFATVDKATQLVAQTGGGLVSNSWSVGEFSGETAYDSHFQTPGIVYVASSGDNAYPARYPSASPYVVSAGGTSILRDSSGKFLSEVAWRNPDYAIGQKLSGVSGGPSIYEPRPSYQNSVAKIVGNARGTPDISFAADPRGGMDIYKTVCTNLENNTGCTSGWAVSGGTSLAAPALAGVLNAANSRATSTAQQLAIIYNGALKNYHSYWHDIIQGNNGYPALQGYDFTTGLGTPLTYNGK